MASQSTNRAAKALAMLTRGKGQGERPVNQDSHTIAARPAMAGKKGKLCRGACSINRLQKTRFGQIQQCSACSSLRPRASHRSAKPGLRANSANADQGRLVRKMVSGWSGASHHTYDLPYPPSVNRAKPSRPTVL